MTRIRITHPDVVHDIGEEVAVDDAKAERLVSIGYADYADDREDPRLRTDDVDGESAPAQPDEPNAEPPAKSANKPDWVAYAVATGADPDDAKAMTKAELVETYGTPGA